MKPGAPVLTAAQMTRAAVGLIATLAGFGFVGILGTRWLEPEELHPGYHFVPVMIVLSFATVVIAIIAKVPGVVTVERLPLGLSAASLGIGLTVWFSGPVWGVLVAMSFLWVGMFANLFLTRRMALVVVAWTAAIYGFILAFQHGNSGPVTRWVLVVGAVAVSGTLVGALADRIHVLVDSDRALRAEYEESTQHLKEAAQLRREFLAGMSHELRTPLNAIIGFADVLTEGLFGSLDAAQLALAGAIRDAGSRLLALVGDVLELDAPDAVTVPEVVRRDELPAAEREPLTRADPRGALAFFLLIPPALATLPHRPPDMHLVPIALIAGVGLAIDMAILLLPRIGPGVRPTAHVTLVTLVTAGVAYYGGAEYSPFATMFFLWMAVAASIRLSRTGARIQLALLAFCEMVLVLVQKGNVDPLFRWEMIMATAIASAVTMRMVVERLFHVADDEARSRRVADDTRSALVAANEHKVEFLRGVREELRWPVDEITSAARELVSGSHHLSDKQREYARDIASAGIQLWSLITDILDLATLESGGMSVDLTDVGVLDVLHDALEDYVAAAASAGVHLEVEVHPTGARVWVDRAKLRRALAGLVSNAVKFTPRGGRVGVVAHARERTLVISVADTGRGIPMEDQVRIFENFQQGGSAMLEPGVGLGLTLARRFVELHGGRLELTSTPGAGSCFTITLPVFDRPASARQEAPVA